MVSKRMRARLFLFLALACAFAQPIGAQTYQGRELVQPQLLADTDAIVPGKPFTVGLLLKMAPHWHTYWKFSGDAGLPSEIKWTLPTGTTDSGVAGDAKLNSPEMAAKARYVFRSMGAFVSFSDIKST